MSIRTLIVDDLPLARDALLRQLQPHPDVEVVGHAGGGAQAIQRVRALQPDLLLLDVQMPEVDGFAVLAAIAEARVSFKVDGRLLVLDPMRIDRVEADGNYVHVHAGGQRWMVRQTLSAVQALLAPHGFERVHRSVLVNLARVEVLRTEAGRASVMLADGSTAALSRQQKRSLLKRLRGEGA